MQSVEHLFFAIGLNLFACQRIAIGRVHRFQRDDILAAQAGNGTGKHRLDPVTQTNFPADFSCNPMLGRSPHEL